MVEPFRDLSGNVDIIGFDFLVICVIAASGKFRQHLWNSCLLLRKLRGISLTTSRLQGLGIWNLDGWKDIYPSPETGCYYVAQEDSLWLEICPQVNMERVLSV